MEKFIIYKITCLKNNKIYIGQTVTDFKLRFKEHLYYLNKNTHYNRHLQNAFNQYGSTYFICEQIESCLSLQHMNEREIYWIDKLEAIKNGYNIHPGGQKKGRGVSVVKYSLEGEKIEEYESILRACSENNCRSSQIQECCRNDKKRTGMFRWRFKTDNIEKLEPLFFRLINGKVRRLDQKENKKKPVIQKTLSGEFVARYSSIREATLLNNFNNASMLEHCLHKRRGVTHAYGFKWEFE